MPYNVVHKAILFFSSLLTSMAVSDASTFSLLCTAMAVNGYLSHSTVAENLKLLRFYLIKLLMLHNGKVKFSCSAMHFKLQTQYLSSATMSE